MAEKSSGPPCTNAPPLKLLASTSSREDHADPSREESDSHRFTNYFKSAEWSPDGTCVISNSADNHIRTFVIPPELLDDRPSPLNLQPYSQISSREPTDAVTVYPGFNLSDPATTLVLSSVNEHPIRLHSSLTSSLVASYPLVNSTTEAYVKPQCLKFTPDGSQFIAGSNNLISIFDLSRTGEQPVLTYPTGPKNSKMTWDNPGMAMRGIVSALDVDRQHNVLAAGTLTRHVGLYDARGFGECLGVFAVQGTEADKQIGGQGITQVLWSLCGRYLYIAERTSDGLMFYDIRQSGQLLGWLEGRRAKTNQRLHVEMFSADGAEHEIWAGGTDGNVRVWNSPHHYENAISPSMEHNMHNDVVNSASLHSSGSILATASGQRHFSGSSEAINGKYGISGDVSLNIWSIPKDFV